mmetsp:Transcript_97888/g.204138  ORF Transcript_97888/g.204138 Transcript_97888/m.204138 type:complete len:226 (+) Transcript_97888:141-818(+)|eukprot:CAMPEP_0206465768 /NCGR_PEP_ID=MMETSP0324_2-20121206/28037_1 /ASSEMBLY_ACC=CAM_ASM_000836 /TAXON_ID=2866 /ORGANISM="Crypthecodinium cohnii, Strain Seligo" /LENGTH=225 /DNA_ID=CAMNT_0053938711 /DNA_START=138 /DNA_END=815 /DNA_ORIENTATION=+
MDFSEDDYYYVMGRCAANPEVSVGEAYILGPEAVDKGLIRIAHERKFHSRGGMEEDIRSTCGVRKREGAGAWVGGQAKMKAPPTPYHPPRNHMKTKNSISPAPIHAQDSVTRTEPATSPAEETRTTSASAPSGAEAPAKNLIPGPEFQPAKKAGKKGEEEEVLEPPLANPQGKKGPYCGDQDDESDHIEWRTASPASDAVPDPPWEPDTLLVLDDDWGIIPDATQ